MSKFSPSESLVSAACQYSNSTPSSLLLEEQKNEEFYDKIFSMKKSQSQKLILIVKIRKEKSKRRTDQVSSAACQYSFSVFFTVT